jgi:DNA polymerase I-like protein with 3'-5' exonuclease and polymerase domains
LQDYREAEKVVTSYGQNWLDALDPDERIRAEFKQIGAERTGRMSCSDPVNLQNPPANEETRGCFRVLPGRKLIIADYSQIELRIAAEFSEDEAMIEAFNSGVDLHQQTADSLNVSRSFAKRLNFGIPYGIGPTKFASQAEIPFDDAKKILASHADKYWGLHSWLRSAEAQAIGKRFSRTMSGRLMRFPVDDNADFRDRKKMLSAIGRNGKNGPIQGTSADILKRAVGILAPQLRGTSAKIVNLVHDEIVVEADTGEADAIAAIVQNSMVTAGEEFIRSVPVPVEAKISEVWLK